MKSVFYAAVFAVFATGLPAQDLTGDYLVNSTNVDGSPYTGTARVTATSEFTCEIVWQTEGSTSSGICMRDGNAFAAGYELGSKVGLVICLIQDDGTLDGTWAVAGVNAVATEVMTPN